MRSICLRLRGLIVPDVLVYFGGFEGGRGRAIWGGRTQVRGPQKHSKRQCTNAQIHYRTVKRHAISLNVIKILRFSVKVFIIKRLVFEGFKRLDKDKSGTLSLDEVLG